MIDDNFIVIQNGCNFLEQVYQIYQKSIENCDKLDLLRTKIFLPNNRLCRMLEDVFLKKSVGCSVIPEIISPLSICTKDCNKIENNLKNISIILRIIDKYDSKTSFFAKYNLALKIVDFVNSLSLEKLRLDDIKSMLLDDEGTLIRIIEEVIQSTDFFEYNEQSFMHLDAWIQEISRAKNAPVIFAGFTYSHRFLMDFLAKSICFSNVIFVQQEHRNFYGLFEKYINYLNIKPEEIKYITVETKKTLPILCTCSDIYNEALKVALFVKYNLRANKKILLVSIDESFNFILKKYLEQFEIYPDDSGGVEFKTTEIYIIFISILNCFLENFSLIAVLSLLNRIYKNSKKLQAFELFCRSKFVVPSNFRNAFLEYIRMNDDFEYKEICYFIIKLYEKSVQIDDTNKVEQLIFEMFWGILHKVDLQVEYVEYMQKMEYILCKFSTDYHCLSCLEYRFLVESIAAQIRIRSPYGYSPNVLLLAPIEAQFVDCDILIVCEYNDSVWYVAEPYFLLFPQMRREIGLNYGERRNANISVILGNLIGQSNESYFFRADFKNGQKQEIASNLSENNFNCSTDIECLLNKLELSFRDIHNKNMTFKKQKTIGINPGEKYKINSLSATDIDKIINKPYEFYAQKILGLKQLVRYDNSNIVSLLKGDIIHKSIEYIDKKYYGSKEDIVKKYLLFEIKNAIHKLNIDISILGDWILKLDNIIDFWYQSEHDTNNYINEAKGEILFKINDTVCIKIKCIADKIQKEADGLLLITDYKCGSSAPTMSEVQNYSKPQLIVESLVAFYKGFSSGWNGVVSNVAILQLGGTRTTLKHVTIKVNSIMLSELEQYLREILQKYFINYIDFTPIKTDYYNEYDHLSRIKEWVS